ncbi:MAG: S4 domain-containing protein [Pseudonocardiaceae bacterium]
MEESKAVSVIDRMVRAGIGGERAREWLRAGAVTLDGERVSDPNTPAAAPSRIVLLPA